MSSAAPHHTFPVSWDEFHRHCKALAWRLLDKGSWEGIIAVSRGGLVPAGIIARELEIRMVESVCISSYDHMQQRELKILKPASAVTADGGKGWLVIDDLADTGKTFEILRKHFPAAHYATVYTKPQGRPLVDSFITEVSQDTWIHFPWDIEPQFSQPIVQSRRNAS